MKQYSNGTMERGVSIYLALMIMSIFLAMSFTISTLLLRQLKMVRGVGNSVIAFYASDTGIEEILIVRASPSTSCSQFSPCCLDNQSCYYIEINNSGVADCDADNYCIKSVGNYKETKRAIEIEY